MRLDTPLVRALGDKTAKVLADKLSLFTVGDLLHHYPRRYFVRGALTKLNELEVGEHVTVLAQVRSSEVHKSRNGKSLGKVVVTDGTGTLDLTFFGRVATWQCARLKPGSQHLFAGTVSVFNQRRQLTHPEVFLDTDEDALAKAGQILPIYPAANGIDTMAIGKALDVVLPGADLDDDPLPTALRLEHGLMSLREALETVHRPHDVKDVLVAADRLRWDESFVLQVVLARRRAEVRLQGGTARRAGTGGLLDTFDASLPFVLTDGQFEVGKVLSDELALTQPMHRLLQGEVGSGKTVIALRAMLTVIDSGGQAALLAPTEVLAQQHARSLASLLGPLARGGQLGSPDNATRVALLTGSLGAAARRKALEEAASGEAGIVVGTHALLSEGVEFHDLGLVVIDEQHRFGVEQRDALRAKGTAPHVLVMTATPIPRTVAMTTYGDLEVSTLRELPAGRSPISTRVVGQGSPQFAQVWDFVREEVSAGRQVFVVCPRIGDEQVETLDPDKRPAMAVLDVVERLATGQLRGLRVEALHGRMSSDAKDDVMGRFALGDVEVLVATTVIEVGVDVPNASVMVVLDADRFGISQLHQLRGRIGRGEHPGTCVLVTEADRYSPSAQRLFAVAGTLDGFELSQLDLEVRREGDVLGADQSGGRTSLRFLRLDDLEVIEQSRQAAIQLVEQDPQLDQHPALKQAVNAILDEQRQAFIEKA
ncbi:MAG: ATP-dependent helicase RecG [Frankiales bacterium]|nr:ATP-dependent helicase RecG [Frankiales bacterium]